MEYNKRKFTKNGDKKILHKVKKQWVVLSMSLLAALGVKALATHPVHASVNDSNANANQNSNPKSSSNVKLVSQNSNANQNQSVANSHTNASTASSGASSSQTSDQIMHQAKSMHSQILAQAMSSASAKSKRLTANDHSNGSSSKASLASRKPGRALLGASSASSAKSGAAKSATPSSSASSGLPKADNSTIQFQFRDQHGQNIGSPITVSGEVGNAITLSDLTNDVSGKAPVPMGYQLAGYYTQNHQPTYFHFNKQPSSQVIHLEGASVGRTTVTIYLHRENFNGTSDQVVSLPHYQITGHVGDTIASPNEFLKPQYSADFGGEAGSNNYHLDNRKGRDRDVHVQMVSDGKGGTKVTPSRIDYYYAPNVNGRLAAMNLSEIDTYYYDRGLYNANKGWDYNDKHSLVNGSITQDKMIPNSKFNYQSRQDNIPFPQEYYYVQNLSQPPVTFGPQGTTQVFHVEVARTSRIIYQIPSDNYKVVKNQLVTGFDKSTDDQGHLIHDRLSNYVIPNIAKGYVESGPYLNQQYNKNGNNTPANYVDNGKTYYVDLTKNVPITVRYFNETKPSDTVYTTPQMTANYGQPYTINNADTVNQKIPSWHLYKPSDAKMTKTFDTPTTVSVPVYQNVKGNVIFYEMSDNRQFPVNSDNKGSVTGAPGMTFGYKPYTPYVPAGYHLSPSNQYINNNWHLEPNSTYKIFIDQNQGHIKVDYVLNSDINNVLGASTDTQNYIGKPFNDTPYVQQAPNGFEYPHRMNHVTTYQKNPQIEYISVTENPKAQKIPKEPTVSSELNYVDKNTNQTVKSMNLNGQPNMPIDYIDYIGSKYMPPYYDYAGLGPKNTRNYTAGATEIIYVTKQKPAPKPKPNPKAPKATIILHYVGKKDGQLKKSMPLRGQVGLTIPYINYITSQYLPTGYGFDGMGPHTSDYEPDTTDVIYVNPNVPGPKSSSAQPKPSSAAKPKPKSSARPKPSSSAKPKSSSASMPSSVSQPASMPSSSASLPSSSAQPAMANITIDYVDDKNGDVEKSTSTDGIVGQPIDYGQYTASDQIPNGYTYAGLGQHTSDFVNGTTDDVMIDKPQPQHRNSKPVSHKKDQIKVIYKMPNGHVIKQHAYHGTTGESFDPNHYKPLPGYYFKKVVLGGNAKKFGKRNQTVIMEMLAAHNHKQHPQHRSSEPLTLKSAGFLGHRNYGASIKEAAAHGYNNVSHPDYSFNHAIGITPQYNNGPKLPQTGERQTDLAKALGLALLAISAALIAGYDFESKRRHD